MPYQKLVKDDISQVLALVVHGLGRIPNGPHMSAISELIFLNMSMAEVESLPLAV